MLEDPSGNAHLVDKQASLIIFLTGGRNCYIPLLYGIFNTSAYL
jgi:hypothetical protein